MEHMDAIIHGAYGPKSGPDSTKAGATRLRFFQCMAGGFGCATPSGASRPVSRSCVPWPSLPWGRMVNGQRKTIGTLLLD